MCVFLSSSELCTRIHKYFSLNHYMICSFNVFCWFSSVSSCMLLVVWLYWVICLILFLQPRILHFLSADELFLALVVMNTSLSHGCIKELKAFMEFSLALSVEYWLLNSTGFSALLYFSKYFQCLISCIKRTWTKENITSFARICFASIVLF